MTTAYAWPVFVKPYVAPRDIIISTVSRSNTWSRGLSPFVLGPCKMDVGTAKVMENAWQYSKVYSEHTDGHNKPTPAYWRWREAGFANPQAVRYPMGKGRKPEYCIWKGKYLSYIEARKAIYAPIYARAVEKTTAWSHLKEIFDSKEFFRMFLLDFDAYDHRKLGWTFRKVLNCETKKMGHAFVLAMMLHNKRRWED